MTKYRKLFILLFIILGCGLLDNVYCDADDTHSMLRGEVVILECPIDIQNCGELHSVKWFKGNERIAVVSGDGELAKVEGDSARISIDHSPTGPITRLRIKNLDISDEDTYLCESTFIDPMEACTSDLAGYKIDVKILVPPSSINMLNEEGIQIQNTTVLGPLREGHTLTATCEVLGTRPKPTVGWYRAGNRLQDSLQTTEKDGLFNVKNDLKLKLSRQELGSFIECRVESPTLKSTVSNQIQLDLQVRPTAIKLTGVEHHVVQGTNVLLQCSVSGARPAANVTWYNKTQELDPAAKLPYTVATEIEALPDSTFNTISKLIFTATRFENEVEFKCEADNIVMRDDLDKPIHDTLTLEVMYPPVVWVSPDNTTVNETANVLLVCQYLANPASLSSVRWLKNGEEVEINSARIEGGVPESTALLIKNVTRHDIGNYTCELANSFGKDESDNAVVVDIQYVPVVNLSMSPEFPVIENDYTNVTLYCNVVEGNPTELIKVRWFLDGSLLKELPECDDDGKGGTAISDHVLCDVESNKLLLQSVTREFWGNYSCEGLNAGGWGERSNETELIVYYEPGNATLAHYPPVPIKRKSVTFMCTVDDGGNPNATRYRWLRNGKAVMDVVTPMWIVDSVGLDSRTNFSCFAYNEGGNGIAASEELIIHAPPFFIQKLPPYSGALFSTPGISLSCRVECYPECEIQWFKEGVGIDDENDDHYFIKSDYLPVDPATGDFESVLSILNFNMSAWPGQKLDVYRDNANYSCVSTRNDVGPGVRSTVFFAVEYPPENITATESVVVQEGSMPPKVLCSAKAFPEPKFEWQRNNEILASGNALIINKAMKKSDAGTYMCTAANRHGSITAEVFMNITYKPDCSIMRKEIDGEDTLICTAMGNPNVYDFMWSIKSENDTTEMKISEKWNTRKDGDKGYLVLDDDTEEMKTYRCVANNSVGIGSICEIDVAGHLPWYHRWEGITFWVLVIGVPLLLLAVIIICIVIICICRKRRRQEKCALLPANVASQDLFILHREDHTDIIINSAHSEQIIGDTHPESASSDIGLTETPIIVPIPSEDIPKSPPKWTLRPGVLVHMKTSGAGGQRISNSTSTVTATPLNGQSNAVSPIENQNQQITDELINFTSSSLIERLLKRLRWRRQKNMQDIVGVDEDGVGGDDVERSVDDEDDDEPNNNNNSNRRHNKKGKSKLRANGNWFGSGKSTNSSTGLFAAAGSEKGEKHIKGIQCTDSVVTYKKTSVVVRPVIGEVPPNNNVATTPSSTNSRKRKKSNPDKSSVAGDPLTEPGEYENLPFHGLQSAPNKLNFHHSNNNNNIHLNTNNSNIVRVAPRPKNISSTYQTSLSSNSNNNNNKYNSNCLNNNNSFISKFNSSSNSNLSNKKHKSTSKILTNNFYPIQQPPPATTTSLMHSQSNHNATVPHNSKSNSNFSNFLINYPINYSLDECPVKNIQHQQQQPHSPLINRDNNPFLVKNHKYYDQYHPPPPQSYHHNSLQQQHTMMMPTAPLMAGEHAGMAPPSGLPSSSSSAGDGNNCDKLKFNSLKNLGIKKAPQFYSMRLNKKLCRRHNNNSNSKNSSNINNNINNINSNSDSNNDNQMPYSEATIQQNENNLNQPVYENLTDSIQIHEQSCSSLQTTNSHNDRTSIYRSDSGISNSSYECLTTTPIAAPRCTLLNGQQSSKLSSQHNNGGASSGHASAGSGNHSNRKCHSAPLYMNVPNLNNNNSNSNNNCNSNNNGGASGSSSSNSHNNHRATARTKHGGKLRGGHNLNNSMGGFLNFERSKTNPFNQQPRRPQQHILVPKELFPSNTVGALVAPPPLPALSTSSSTSSTSSNTGPQQAAPLPPPQSHHKSSRNRPIKLPLRKHHSFHFQTSQTTLAAVAALKQSKSKNYKNNGGPLIFKPFENSERSAFKPITPAPRSPESAYGGPQCRPNSASQMAFYTPPRVCGTSLKRHMSNVETTVGSLRPMRNHHVAQQQQPSRHHRSTNSLTDSDNDDESTLSIRSMIVGGGGGRGKGGASTKSTSKLQYADLLPPETFGSSLHTTNYPQVMVDGNNITPGTATNNSLLNSTSTSSSNTNSNEKIKLKNFTSDNNNVNNSINNNNNNNINNNNNSNNKRTITQYATLKFNEVNI